MTKPPIDINETTVKEYVESIRPKDPEIRKQVDIGYNYENKTFVLYEIRLIWDKPNEIQHIEFAKIRFYKSKHAWNLYWMRANGKWELYDPFSKSSYLQKIIEIIKEDKNGCFFG